MWIDTHTHLYDEQFNPDRHQAIKQAISAGVEQFYLPNCDASTIEGMLALESAFPDHCFPMMGLHPCSVKESVTEELRLVKQWLDKRYFVAVGEIGLDYYWDKTYIQQQHDAFRQQMQWAIDFDIPIVIHNREATQDTINLVKEFSTQGISGVFHCFTGSYETARQIIDMGFYLGIGGVLTYKNAGLQEVVQKIDLTHLVLETDAPYLSPVPYRGKRNESRYIPLIGQRLAELKSLPLAEVREKTSVNALKLFRQQRMTSNH